MKNKLIVCKELNGIIELWKEVNKNAMDAFKESQEAKKTFVAEFDPDDFAAYHRFKRLMDGLENERDNLGKFARFIEDFAEKTFEVNLHEELILKQKQVEVKD